MRHHRAQHLAIGLFLITFLGLAPPGQAQTGQAFVEHQSWYIDDFGFGVLPDGLGNLRVEFDGQPGISGADHTHPVPPEADQGLSPFRNYNLSPSRRFLSVTGTSSTGFGTRMYLYRVPQTDGAPLEYIAGGLALANGIAFQGYFDYDVPGLPAIYFAVENSGIAQTQRIYWLNLESGIASFSNDIPASVQWPVTFAPTGIAAFIQHDGTFAGQSTYRLVELCDDDLGTFLNQTGAPFDDLPSPLASAYLAGNAGAGFTAEVVRGGTILGNVPLDDCSGVVPPPVGACCLEGNCLPGMTETACEDAGGTWQGAGSDCATVNCPPPAIAQLTLTGTGPSQASVGASVGYSFQVSNTGTAPATQTVLSVSIPAGTTFLSASAGGDFDPTFQQVTWNLGTLDPGDNVTSTCSVTVGCGAFQLILSNYRVTASGLTAVFGNSLNVPVDQPSGVATVSITATPSVVPLGSGDTLVYTFDLLNTGGDQSGVTFSGLYGDHVDFDGVINSGGGVFSHNGAGFSWTGDLPDGAARQVSFRVQVRSCRGPYPESTTLSFGNQITLYGACSDMLASLFPPAPVPVEAPDLETTVVVTPPVAPRILGADGWTPPTLVRAGMDLEVTWQVINRGNSSQNISLAQCQLNGLAPSQDPPFLGTPPPGVSWDSGGNQILFSGLLAPGDTLTVPFEIYFPGDAGCRQPLWVLVATDDCPQAASASTSLASVDRYWQASHLILSTSTGEVQRMWTDLEHEPETWFCLQSEYTSSMTQSLEGALWLNGYPHFRIDPATLELWVLGYGFLNQVGMGVIWEIYEDAHRQVFLGGTVLVGSDYLVSVVRWDPVSNATTLVWQEQTGNVGDITSIGSMQIDQDGILAMTTPQGVVRLDVNDPAGAVLWTDPVMTMGYDTLTRHTQGPYYVTDPVWSPQAEALVEIDPTTGVHTVVVPDLNAFPGHDVAPYVALAADDQDRVFLVTQFGPVSRVDFGETPPVWERATSENRPYSGLIWEQVGITSPVVEEVPPVTLKLALHPPTPNPFNPRTTLSFDLPRAGQIKLALYDLRGRHVQTLVSGQVEAGAHTVVWQGTDAQGQPVSSGVYLARMETAGKVMVTKLMLTR
jgi:uncharacterized repeat protein (TIGR01451 family)